MDGREPDPGARLAPATTRSVRASRPRGQAAKLSGEDMLFIARLHRAGHSAAQIARVLTTPERSISAQAVGVWLRRAKTNTEDVYMALASLRGQAVESWDLAMRRGARDGRHAPSKDLLQATGVIQATPAASVTVIIGAGPQAAPDLPDLPAHAVLVE